MPYYTVLYCIMTREHFNPATPPGRSMFGPCPENTFVHGVVLINQSMVGLEDYVENKSLRPQVLDAQKSQLT